MKNLKTLINQEKKNIIDAWIKFFILKEKISFKKITKVKYLSDYKLKVVFDNGEKRIADFKDFLFKSHNPMTTQFRDKKRFKNVSIAFGHLTWEDGQMDIPAESIYNNEFASK